MGRPREHGDVVADALLRAAEEIVVAAGAGALSLRAVADRAGTTTRAVYTVFGSKQGLLAALAARLFDLLVEAIDRLATTDDPRADLEAAALDGFRRTALDHPALYRLVFSQVVPELPDGGPHVESAMEAFGRLRALVARLPGVSGADSATIDAAARTVHALTEGLAAMELRGDLGGRSAAARTWRTSLRTVLDGLS